MEENEIPEVGFGFGFLPTAQELTEFYLRRKNFGLPLSPNNPITDRDLYGGKQTDPWILFGDDDPCWITVSGQKLIYAFIQVEKGRQKHTSRTAGCGTWHNDRGKEMIKNEQGQLVGYLKISV